MAQPKDKKMNRIVWELIGVGWESEIIKRKVRMLFKSWRHDCDRSTKETPLVISMWTAQLWLSCSQSSWCLSCNSVPSQPFISIPALPLLWMEVQLGIITGLRARCWLKLTRSLCFQNVLIRNRAPLVAQSLKCLPAMRETWVWSLGWEDPLEKELANPLQDSCLENPMDGGTWWATVHGVTKSRIELSEFTF